MASIFSAVVGVEEELPRRTGDFINGLITEVPLDGNEYHT